MDCSAALPPRCRRRALRVSSCMACFSFTKRSRSSMLDWRFRTIKLTLTMSLRRASPRSLAMPSTSSSKSKVPPWSTSSVSKRSTCSSSEMSKSRRMSRNSLNCRRWSKRSGVSLMRISSSTSTNPKPPGETCISAGNAPAFACSRQISSTSNMARSANIFWSAKRCCFMRRSLTFAAAKMLSTKILAITLNKPKVIKTVATAYAKGTMMP
mmetsp:Transcript_8857/g.25401  ORF Transcript_8857/g.25401 Transcript_8857/m.25401 type:complete len:211 (+) Transcript_8857:106-738(+)